MRAFPRETSAPWLGPGLSAASSIVAALEPICQSSEPYRASSRVRRSFLVAWVFGARHRQTHYRNGPPRACREFLRIQLETQRPRLVLTLGAWVPRYLAPLAPALKHWEKATTLKQVDMVGDARNSHSAGPLVRSARLHTGQSVVVAALSHPSFYPRSASARQYTGRHGVRAHELLLKDAVSAAGIMA